MNADLLRQRRNLIVVSGVLLIFDFSQVKITKVSVLGTELFIGNAQVLMACAWILWAYFLLRYYQYWCAEPESYVRAAFSERLDHYARSYTKAKPVQEPTYGQVYDNYKIARVGFAKWTYTVQTYDVSTSGLADGPTHRLPLWRMVLWWVRASAYVCFQTPHATDHVLPFVLALAAPITAIATAWHWLPE